MAAESAFIESLRAFAGSPAARGLADDAAVLSLGRTTLVLTHDMIVEGVHFLSADPPEDVAWKLVAVNLSDLAAKGAAPVGALLGYTLARDADWDAAFARGLDEALRGLGLPLLGGDTVSAPPGSRRAFGLTAIGTVESAPPARGGARPGDLLWVSGAIGDAGAGLRVATGGLSACPALLERYRRPRPRLEAGGRLTPVARAMMDVSDGLLIDAARMAEASGAAVELELRAVPLSADYVAHVGDDRAARIDAAVAGDDYELLFAAPEERSHEILRLSEALGLSLTRIGRFHAGTGLRLRDDGETLALPERLGWEHRAHATG